MALGHTLFVHYTFQKCVSEMLLPWNQLFFNLFLQSDLTKYAVSFYHLISLTRCLYLYVLLQKCYICEVQGKGNRAYAGACMQCNKSGCKQQFHVTCAQTLGLLCEEAGNYQDNVKYCGYCEHHYSKLVGFLSHAYKLKVSKQNLVVVNFSLKYTNKII
jgi:hypothetical protein